MNHALIEPALALIQVILIDLTLAADNAVVVGLAAAGLKGKNRAKAIAIGIAAATVLRVGFALIASLLLDIVGGVVTLSLPNREWRGVPGFQAIQAAIFHASNASRRW